MQKYGHGGQKKVGLVLGAGGPVGHAFHAGVLRALSDVISWDPRTASTIVGTSAGAQVGALLRAGLSSHDLAARASGVSLSRYGATIAKHYTRPNHRIKQGPRRFRPADPYYFLRRPWQLRPGSVAAALLPRGRASMQAQADGFRVLFGERWPSNPLWITAVQMRTGRAVAFGHASAPRTDVGTAVISSGAVPGIWKPVRVDGEHYVDGGMVSMTHLDLMVDAQVDVVVVSSPLSRFSPLRGLLRSEMGRLQRRGIEVIAFEPGRDVCSAMGWNMMDVSRSKEVCEVSYKSLRRSLESKAGIQSGLLMGMT